MRLMILTATLACLTMSTAAHASEIASIAPHVGFPVPAHDIGSDQLGVSAGVAFVGMASPRVGVGIDVAYHYWPASPGYTVAFSHYLSNTYFEELAGPTYAFRVIQVTPHARLLAWPTKRWCPWLQVGGGMYVVDLNVSRATWTGNSRVLGPGPDTYSVTPGWNLGVGCDLRSADLTSVGFDVTMHSLLSQVPSGSRSGGPELPGLIAITSGVHFRFGW